MSPHIPLRPYHYQIRQYLMNKNGIHIIYPVFSTSRPCTRAASCTCRNTLQLRVAQKDFREAADSITVIAAGAVRDMGRPEHSGMTIRISIRKTLGRYIFFPDYLSRPVVAAFHDLVSTGHHYVPRFSKNFNVRQVHMEVFY
ncbi:uncharacterized protein [Dermacentor albipictus]|uniref:uncharacterized protein isoform X3 n=1 Tax=Dermacentor albipictus TaxID=60249 RepID=UPI0038FCEB6D